jgi:toxin ParE1/3/4
MEYRVEIMPRAQRDLLDLYQNINARSSNTALLWYRGLQEAIRSLRDNPERCPATPENREVRHLLYGNGQNIYRVIYRFVKRRKKVDILHVRHGARQGFKAVDL